MAKQARAELRRGWRSTLRRTNPARIEILTYHFVSDRVDSFTASGHTVRTAVFRAQLCWLKHAYEIVRLRDLAHLTPSRRPGRPFAAITFDDGYASNLREAYPILEAERVPATLFVCPSVLGNRDLLWRDKVRYLINHQLEDAFVAFLRELPDRRYRFTDLTQRSFYRWSKDIAAIGDMSIQRDLDAFFTLRQISGAELAARHELFLSARDLEARPFLDFGNHTWSHPVMPALPREAQRQEIARADEFLAARGIASVGLALPFTDYNDDTVAACKSLGTPIMLTVQKRSNAAFAPAARPRILHRWMAPRDLGGLREIL